MLDQIFLQILNRSFNGAIVIVLVLLARVLLRKAPKVFSYTMWSVVLFRLACPFSFESIYSLLPTKANPISHDIAYVTVPEIDTGIAAINHAVNAVLPAATPQASINPIQIWIGIGRSIWIFGMAVLLVYSLLTFLRLKKHLQSASLYQENIFISDNLYTAFVIGLFRPKIYLPSALNQAEQNYILLHEQAHIKRLDHIIKFASFLVLCVHWFNPLVWVAFFVSGKDMEMACDEAVIKRLGNDIKKDYSSSLLTLATGRRMVGGMPLAFGEGDTKGRIKNVLHYKKPSFWVMVAAVLVVVLVSAGLLANPKQKTSMTAEQAAASVADSVRLENESIYFTIPKDYYDSKDFNIFVYGTVPMGNSERSVHLFEEENASQSWASGQTYTIDVKDKGYTDLNMSIYMHSDDAVEKEIDLLEYLQNASDYITSITFPAYDQRTESNTEILDIEPFTLHIQLPAGWSVEAKGENDTKYPLIGAWTPLGIYNEEDEYIGTVGYNIYEEYEGAEEVPQAIYNQIALGNHYRFNAQTTAMEEGGKGYTPVAKTDNGVTATTEVYASPQISKELGYGDEQHFNKGILSYDKDLHVYIAIELNGEKVTDDMLVQMAASVKIVKQN